MSQVSWYPTNPRSRRDFFLRSFPIFVVLIIFLYFGLDWLGAFEFLEVLVRDNSAWLMKIIFGMNYDDFTRSFYERIDEDILTGWTVDFGYPHFPGIEISGYPKTLIIIRACTGMEAGALLMALILVTPAKWYQKGIAQVVNFLMMHIGNTFRVAFHFWFTNYLYGKTIFGKFINDDLAFFWAHDMLSKVFGFIGIVIFTLVIERTGVKIVSTFGAWMDAIGEGLKRLTWKIEKRAFYTQKSKKNNNLTIDPSEKGKNEEISKSNAEKTFFYPTKEISKNKWNFAGITFGIFAVVTTALLMLGFIPGFSKIIAESSDNIAINWFGAIRYTFEQEGSWWVSVFLSAPEVKFKIGLFGTGLGLVAFMIGLIIATPGEWLKKLWTSLITIVSIFPLYIFSLGLQKFLIHSLAANDTFRINHPLLYFNFADLLVNFFPFFMWILGFTMLMLIYHAFEIKTFYVLYAWLHQLYILFLRIIGLRKDKKHDEIFSDEAGTM